MKKMGVLFSVGLYILGPVYSVKNKTKIVLMNFLFGEWLLGSHGANKMKDCGPVDPVLVLKELVSARLKAEYAYYSLVNDFVGFQKVWCTDGDVCTVGEEEGICICI